jgi:hypothetical protein
MVTQSLNKKDISGVGINKLHIGNGIALDPIVGCIIGVTISTLEVAVLLIHEQGQGVYPEIQVIGYHVRPTGYVIK